MRRSHVLVLAKSPVPGKVKTRLCPPCAPGDAAVIAAAALADTLDAVARCGAERHVLALDGRPGPWLPPGFEVIPQVDGPLDRRLTAAWLTVGGPGMQIGMDTPQVTARLLDTAIELVTSGASDAALGLADDGGWWATAFAQPHPFAFLGVPMSTAHTGRAQSARLHALGLRVAFLPAMRDIDTFDDAVAVAEMIPNSRTADAVAAIEAAVA